MNWKVSDCVYTQISEDGGGATFDGEWCFDQSIGLLAAGDPVPARYRYNLWRELGSGQAQAGHGHSRAFRDPLVFCMLNPSTADAFKLDPTVNRCRNRAIAMGHDGLVVVNVFAYRATDPKELEKALKDGVDIVGPLNDVYIAEACAGRRVIMAFGANKLVPMQMARWSESRLASQISATAKEVLCLRQTKSGWPEHPLYLPDALEPKPWNWGMVR